MVLAGCAKPFPTLCIRAGAARVTPPHVTALYLPRCADIVYFGLLARIVAVPLPTPRAGAALRVRGSFVPTIVGRGVARCAFRVATAA